MKRRDSILQNYYMSRLPKFQGAGPLLKQRYGVGPMMGDLATQTGAAEELRKAKIAAQRAALEAKLKKEREQAAAIARYKAMPKVGPARQLNYSEQVAAEEQRRRLNQQYADQNPEVTIDNSGDIVPSGYGRFMQTYGPNIEKFGRSLETPLGVMSLATGAGSIASNTLRLGASALEKKIGRNLVSRGLKNFTGKVTPVINSMDDIAAYAQLDPLGIMGNRLNALSYNPTTALNTATNTITGVGKNLTNSGIETADLVLGENNTVKLLSKEVPASTFKSEIDWGKWNPETPNYAELINEYNAIEESTKKAGTWMKNLDGSPFQGTPEQFIQQQSSWFKKAFGDSKLVNPDGSPMFLYHGSAKKFDTFDPSKFQLGDAGYSGVGIYTTPSKTTADSYSISSVKLHTGDIEPTLYQLYGQGNRPIKSSELIKENKGRELFNFYRDRNWKGEISPYESLREYDVAVSDQLPNVENIRPLNNAREIVFPKNTQLKSATGNVGFFDMTNPNIYKALVPAVIGTGTLQQKKEGGIVKDNMGYWNPENWGKPVEISSNKITMKGVDQPLVGISNTGDVKYMQPSGNYTFHGTTVTEYPMTKWLDDYKAKLGGPYNSSWMLTNPKPKPVYVPKMQFAGVPGQVGMPGWANQTMLAIGNLFSNSEQEPTKQPIKEQKQAAINYILRLSDPRKTRMTTGQALDPNKDLLTGNYDTHRLRTLLERTKARQISEQDAWNLAAMALQESGWGKTDENIGHVIGSWGGKDPYDRMINAYTEKMKLADKMKITDPYQRLQVYNGFGKIFPSTEQKYHGFKMKKIYGVPVPTEGIDLRKNPLYGKQVIDVRDNILRKNPEFVQLMDEYYEDGGWLNQYKTK